MRSSGICGRRSSSRIRWNRSRERHWSRERFRSKPDSDGIPGFPQFGKGYGVHVTGLTHDERGYPCATNPKLHETLVMRLVDKIESARHEIADYDILNPDAELVFIAYGAPVRTVQQVLHDHPHDNIGFLRIRTVWPFPEFALGGIQKCTAFPCTGNEPWPDRP